MISASTKEAFLRESEVLDGEEKTVPAPIVEPTCAAFGTTKKQPRASNGGKNKERPSCPWRHERAIRSFLRTLRQERAIR